MCSWRYVFQKRSKDLWNCMVYRPPLAYLEEKKQEAFLKKSQLRRILYLVSVQHTTPWWCSSLEKLFCTNSFHVIINN